MPKREKGRISNPDAPHRFSNPGAAGGCAEKQKRRKEGKVEKKKKKKKNKKKKKQNDEKKKRREKEKEKEKEKLLTRENSNIASDLNIN